MEKSGIAYSNTSCAVCGLVYATGLRPDFMSRSRSVSERMIFLVVEAGNRENGALGSFLDSAAKRGFVGKYVCSHGLELRMRGTEIELASVEHVISLLRLPHDIEWIQQFHVALLNPTPITAKKTV